MGHTIDSAFDRDIAFEYFETSFCHDFRRNIIGHIGFPKFSCFKIFFFKIQNESFSVNFVFFSIKRYIANICNKFIDTDSKSFSLHGDTVKFSTKELIFHEEISRLSEDDMGSIFLGSSFQTRSEIHRVSENRIVKTIM